MIFRKKQLIYTCAAGLVLAALAVTAPKNEGRVEAAAWVPVADVQYKGQDYSGDQWAYQNNGQLQLISQNAFGQNRINARAGIDIGMYPAWSAYQAKAAKRDVVVAVIDTGVNIFHEDLAGSIWQNDEIPGNGIDDDGNGYVDDVFGWDFYDDDAWPFNGTSADDHGTHAAGTIAASHNGTGINGINDGSHVKIMALRALGTESGTGTIRNVIRAIEYAEANGASICNLSFGTFTDSQHLYEVMKNSKMLFVVAAGNGDKNLVGMNIDAQPIYPASYDLDNIISVASIQMDGALDPSSNYGQVSVDLAAPGSYILSTIADGNYGYMSGTSMAAPFVTGAAAMVASYHPGLTMIQVKNILFQTVVPHTSLAGKVSTNGMLNLNLAMTLAGQI